MDGRTEIQKRLASLLDEVAVHEGLSRTLVEGVELARISKPSPRAPMVYQPNIIILGQGRKRAYLGGEVYTYDAFNYLALSVPIPADCETIASAEEPLLLVAIHVQPTMLGEMLLEMDETPQPMVPTPRGISTSPMSEELGGSVIRLLECLRSPLDSRMLGRQTVREIIYRVLRGEQGNSLRALASRDDHFARIARVLKQIHADYARPLASEDLARKAGMSVSAFHHNFKLVTGSSPLQYLKRIRLDHARRLLAIQPGVQATLRDDAHRGGRTNASETRDWLINNRVIFFDGSSTGSQRLGHGGAGRGPVAIAPENPSIRGVQPPGGEGLHVVSGRDHGVSPVAEKSLAPGHSSGLDKLACDDRDVSEEAWNDPGATDHWHHFFLSVWIYSTTSISSWGVIVFCRSAGMREMLCFFSSSISDFLSVRVIESIPRRTISVGVSETLIPL
jgi:AraC-like DNA-binding protein